MDSDDLQVVLSLLERNVRKLQANLSAYNHEIALVHKALSNKWQNDSYLDGHAISAHNSLLRSVNAVNEYVIKLNLHINLNRKRCMSGIDANENFRAYEGKSLERFSSKITLESSTSNDKDNKQCLRLAQPYPLLIPQGGKHMSSEEVYDRLIKNISIFATDSVVEAILMHVNVAENCIFVGKWESAPIKKLLASKMPLVELQQLPDIGDIFAVYDEQQDIMPRALINAPAESGGFDAYLLDYGEHIHLDGKETIYELPQDVAALPAEAVRCKVRNYDVAQLTAFLYQHVRLRILANNGNDLEVEFLMKSEIQSADQLKKELPNAIYNDNVQLGMQLSDSQMGMLETVEEGTSNALKAVLGINPSDDQRICRHFDPKMGGCFKGSSCRLVHQQKAPHGATKDKELIEALPEVSFVSAAPRSALGSVVRVEVTYINSLTQIYVQFVNESTPLVWSKEDIAESELKLRTKPRSLDVVLALYNDGYYYRAQIIDDIDGLYQIFYVDYGNTEFVTINSLAYCNDARSLKPHQAVSCCIEGVKCTSVSSGDRSVECIEFLKGTILNAQFDVLLVSQLPDGYVIRLLDRYVEIVKQMIKRGFAEPDMF